MRLVLRDVQVDQRQVDVVIEDGLVAEVAEAAPPRFGETVVDGCGGALIPGLHDHHVHLMAAAAQRHSIDCSAPGTTVAGLVGAARRAEGDWVRVTGYHESLAGPLDRTVLDGWLPDRPLRVQHRSGALWVLNSLALERVATALDSSDDVGRDAAGRPDGRLWRYDVRLRSAVPRDEPDLGALGRELVSYGITGVTDATPDLDTATADLLGRAVADGRLPVEVTLLGSGSSGGARDVRSVPRKVVVEDHDLPGLPELVSLVRQARGEGRPVAVHTVSAESLALTLAALRATGVVAGDRLEHAAVLPVGLEADVAELGLVVVTQPDFLRTRGDTYLQDVPPSDLPALYRDASLRSHGIGVVVSSDAPYGSLDPWQVMRSARDRRTSGGVVLGLREAVPVATALDDYLRDPLDLAGPPRRVEPGTPAALCLLHVPLADALARPHASNVRLTVTHHDGRARLHPSDPPERLAG